MELLQSTPPSEFVDVGEKTYTYVQKIDFSLYHPLNQNLPTEFEDFLGSFLSHNPEFVFKQQTSHDLCKIKSNQICFKTKTERKKSGNFSRNKPNSIRITA